MAQPAPQHETLTRRIVIGLCAAVVLAIVIPNGLQLLGAAEWTAAVFVPIDLGGQVFMRLLKMVVVPLVVTSVMTGVLGLGDIRKLGRPGLTAVTYYFTTTVMAVVLGQLLVNAVRPGAWVDEAVQAEARAQAAAETAETATSPVVANQPRTAGDIVQNLVLMLFSENMLNSAVRGDLLPLIVFSIVFAGILTTMGKRAEGLTKLIGELNDALMRLIMLIMQLAPVGIFCLVLARFGSAVADGELLRTLQQIGAYFFTVVLGLAIHGLVVLPVILWLWTGRNPYRFILQVSQALLMAFSTSSSSAALPVTIERTIHGAGVSRKSVDFVVPLGSTINMDGTALYEAVAAIFIAQTLGIFLPWHAQIVVAVTATLAAIGAAGIPQAGLVTMPIVLSSAGIPTSGMALILTIDWFLDRFRTLVNVLGDAMGAAVVEGSFDPETPDAPLPGEAEAGNSVAVQPHSPSPGATAG